MNSPRIGLAPEGSPVIGLLTVIALCSSILEWWPLAVAALILLAFTLHFFRDPERIIPQEADIAVSPADGRIIRIEEKKDPFTDEKRMCISVFMNVFNVHVNRSPVTGAVTAVRYWPGKFFNAAWDKASSENERCAWQLEDPEGSRWSFIQISGLIARRIVPYAEQGDRLLRGQRFGMIRFGSRVDVYLPANYTSAVGIGDEVFAGQTILAKKNEY